MLTVVSGDGSGPEGGKDHASSLNAPHLVALVRAGACFEDGELAERPDGHAPPAAA